MADELVQDVTADSSTAADQTADPSQATTQPGQNGGPQSQYVPYERFQQVNTRMHAAEQRAQQLEARIAQLEQVRERTGQPPSEEEQQLRAAREALHRVDPSIPKLGEQMQQITGMLTGLAQERFVSTGERLISDFAHQHGLDASALSERLADIIRNDPRLLARAQQGDLGLVNQYLRGLEPVVSALKGQTAAVQRAGAVATATTKLNQSKLPPRSTGGAPGPSAPQPLNEDNERDFRRSMHNRAFGAWEDAQTKG